MTRCEDMRKFLLSSVTGRWWEPYTGLYLTGSEELDPPYCVSSNIFPCMRSAMDEWSQEWVHSPDVVTSLSPVQYGPKETHQEQSPHNIHRNIVNLSQPSQLGLFTTTNTNIYFWRDWPIYSSSCPVLLLDTGGVRHSSRCHLSATQGYSGWGISTYYKQTFLGILLMKYVWTPAGIFLVYSKYRIGGGQNIFLVSWMSVFVLKVKICLTTFTK